MNITRRSFLATGTAAIGALAIPAMRAQAASPINLSISPGVPTFVAMMNALESGFHAEHPEFTAKFVADGENWDTLLQNTLRESIVGALPDLTWQALTFAENLARRGIAQPLNAIAGDANAVEKLGISRSLTEATRINDKVVAVPFGTTIPVVYYNMTLLRKAGYQKLTLPRSWDEVTDAGKRVAALGGNVTGCYIEYTSTNAWIFQNLLASFGGHMMNPGRTGITFDGNEGLEAMQTLARVGEINNVDMTMYQARQTFDAGMTGIQIASASRISSVAKASAGHFELQIGEFPIPNPRGRLVGAGNGFFIFTKKPERQKAAWEFIKFAAQSKGQSILAQYTGFLPVNLSMLNDPTLLEQYLKANPYHRSIIKNLAVTDDQFSFPTPKTVEITDMMIEEMRMVVTKREKPKDALTSMAARARKLLQA
ncbi:extracellular solute-binding protein [Burkholderia cepacia]|uniref:extracellular solute-binding protein n=1 Tax=Burkholderia cepacia TaxID=292 RepID=UPI002AB60F60|nr:extracellular solute-binding protein [Burkholderia cepacia]